MRTHKKAHEAGREMSPALIEGLAHPVRRQILRVLSEPGATRGPSDLFRDSINFSLPGISYHAKTLCELNVIRPAGPRPGSSMTVHTFASNVADNKLVSKILKSTEGDDVFLCRRSTMGRHHVSLKNIAS